MFVIKQTRITVNRKGVHCFLVSYWNAKLQRFAAEPWASAFPAETAEQIKDNLTRIFGRNIYNPAPPKFSIVPANTEITAIEAPEDAPQFQFEKD